MSKKINAAVAGVVAVGVLGVTGVSVQKYNDDQASAKAADTQLVAKLEAKKVADQKAVAAKDAAITKLTSDKAAVCADLASVIKNYSLKKLTLPVECK